MKLHLAVILSIVSCTVATELDVVYEWKYIDYLWDSAAQKNDAIAKNRYDYTQIFTIDVQKVQDGRVFITTPAFNPTGVSATLSTVSRRKGPGGPLLRPYPNWSWHNPDTIINCNRMTSVWRVTVDDCNRLWVLDSGNIGDTQVCPAQVLVFDLRTDRLLKRIKIPKDVSQDPQNKTLGLLVTISVETEGFYCQRPRVYIADVVGGGLIIVDGPNIWRLDNAIFDPDPDASNFTIAGQSFFLPDGILGMALTPGQSSYERRLFFRYTTYDYQLPSQAAGQAFSQDGILFFGLATEIAIACWNMNTPMNKQNVVIVAQNNETLQFSSGVKVSKNCDNPEKEELWATTNRLQKIYTGTQNFSEINYRVLSGFVDRLIDGSRCQLQCNRDH